MRQRRHNGKGAKLTSEPRTLRKPEKQDKREDAALRERANGKGRNHHDKLAANQQITPNDAPDSVSERRVNLCRSSSRSDARAAVLARQRQPYHQGYHRQQPQHEDPHPQLLAHVKGTKLWPTYRQEASAHAGHRNARQRRCLNRRLDARQQSADPNAPHIAVPSGL